MIRSLSAADPITASWLLALLAVFTVVVLIPVARLLLAGLLYGLGRLSGRRHLLAAASRVMPRLGHLLGGLVIGAASVAAPAMADPARADVGLVALDRDGSAPTTPASTPPAPSKTPRPAPTPTPSPTQARQPTPSITLERGGEAHERALATARPSRTERTNVATPASGTLYVVRTGDTLWDIAAEHLEQPTDAAITEGWKAIWRANRSVIGEHPELIHPGQVLRLDGFQA